LALILGRGVPELRMTSRVAVAASVNYKPPVMAGPGCFTLFPLFPHGVRMKPHISLAFFSTLVAFASQGVQAQTPAATNVPVCVHDESVKERFLPVELLTGSPMPATNELTMVPVDRVYPFIDELPGGKLGSGDVALKGPVEWKGQGGTLYQVYERKVPRAEERYAMTPDRTAMGRVYDQRSGNITNEGKYPIGLWAQGQKRSYNTVYEAPRGSRVDVTYLQIDKLSCTYEGVAGAMQYTYGSNRGINYGYIYVPGKGLTHVMTRNGGN
jgi:hypothetical protein